MVWFSCYVFDRLRAIVEAWHSFLRTAESTVLRSFTRRIQPIEGQMFFLFFRRLKLEIVRPRSVNATQMCYSDSLIVLYSCTDYKVRSLRSGQLSKGMTSILSTGSTVLFHIWLRQPGRSSTHNCNIGLYVYPCTYVYVPMYLCELLG